MLKRFAALSPLTALLTLASLLAPASMNAQTATAVARSARVLSTDLGPRTQLSHHVPVYADTTRLSSDPMPENASFSRLTIMLSRAPQVQAAFDQLTADQQNPASPRYHQWLTPEQVGELYGPAQSDVDAVVAWLQSQNLTVLSVAPSHLFINFSGTVSAVQKAFSTDFRLFHLANGETRYSLLNEPSIPSAIVPVVANVVGLSQSIHRPALRRGERQPASTHSAVPDALSPQYTLSNGEHFLVAADFATAYDITPVYNAGFTGSGIKVAIAGESRVDATDISNLQTVQGQNIKQPNIIVPPGATDPGYTGGNSFNPCSTPTACTDSGLQDEATLDVNRVLGTAPGATADLVIASDVGQANTFGTQGLWIAIDHEITTLKDPILSISFGGCEGLNSATATAYEDSLFQTATSEGITVFVSSGDEGAAACNAFYNTIPTTACSASGPISSTHACQQLSINDLCASQYVTCVGGTEFAADAANPGTYWNTANNSSNQSSMRSYIPEGTWNDIDCSDGTSTLANCRAPKTYVQGSGGGGVSVYLPKPTWQNGVTTISSTSNFRWAPDVSFTSSADHDGYLTFLEYMGANIAEGFYSFGGTSAAAPSMAGIQALIEQKLNTGAQGNINPTLYAKGIAGNNMFHDVTLASSGVANCVATTPSLCNNSTPTPTSVTGGQAGYLVGTGWDAATGWGSLDVNNYLTAASITLTSTTTVVTVPSTPASAGSAVTLTAAVAPTAATGTVQFYANGTAIGSAQTLAAGAASLSYTFNTGGTYSITATYSGDTTYATSTSSAVPLGVNAPFGLSPASNTVSSLVGVASTDTIGVASVAPFAGSVALACTVTPSTAGTCSLATSPVTLASGGIANSILTITPQATGNFSVTVTGTSGSISSATTIAVSAYEPFSLTSTPTSLTFISGATTGATSTINVVSNNGFTGNVGLTCQITSSSAVYQPTCSFSSNSVTAPGTATLTIGSHVPVTSAVSGSKTAGLSSWEFGAFALALLALLPLGQKRRALRSDRYLTAFALLALGAASITGCGGGGSAPTPPPATQSSAGTYTVTVTGTANGVTATTTVAVNIEQ